MATDDRGVVHIWDVESGNLDLVLKHTSKSWIEETAFSQDGRWFAAIATDRGGDPGSLALWRADAGEKISLLKENITDHWNGPLAFSPDGRLLACYTGYRDYENKVDGETPEIHAVTVWDMETGKIAAHLTDARARNLCISPCGRYLAAGLWASIEVWDIAAGQMVQSYSDYGERYIHVSYTPEGVLRAAAVPGTLPRSDGSLSVWDVEQKRTIYIDEPRENYIHAAFLDGTTLAYFTDREWRVWEYGEEEPRVGKHTHIDCPHSLRFLPDGKTLAAVSIQNGVDLWDVQTPQRPPRVFRPAGEGKFSIDVSPEGKLFIVSVNENENAVRLREIDSAAPPIEYKGPIFAEISHTSLSIAAGLASHSDEGGNTYLWDAGDGRLIRIEDSRYSGFQISPDGKYLIGGGEWEGWNLRDIQSREYVLNAEEKRIDTSEDHNSAFSPDGRTIVGYGHDEEMIVLWGIERREARLTIPWPDAWDISQTSCESYAFSSDGRYLAGCYKEGTGHVWSVDTGEQVAVFECPGAYCLAFSPDGSILAVADFGGTIRLWDMTPYI
ncbi:MAG: WD40 repeat domain-containing protein [Candidatus Poribacteria bacterium]|nr:WD40 repeat domain-containing protein [Candidatus Poribacteria bacterium]